MSGDRIDHVAEARRLLGRSVQWSEPDTAEIGADIAALTNATLALVEQQRIANLLVAGEARVVKLDPWDFGSDTPDLKPEIREALGL